LRPFERGIVLGQPTVGAVGFTAIERWPAATGQHLNDFASSRIDATDDRSPTMKTSLLRQVFGHTALRWHRASLFFFVGDVAL
jgi:hypothetical protein